MLIKLLHDVWPAINSGFGLILRMVSYAIACKTANAMFIDNSGCSCITVVAAVVRNRLQKRLKVAYQIEWGKMLFPVRAKF